MRSLFQLATALLLAATLAPAQHAPQVNKKERPQHEDVEWIWQYTPADTNKDGRENELVQDPHFRPFLDQFLTAPQTFWGGPYKDGHYRSLSDTALEHLTVPGKVLADDNRYISISGGVLHFGPARGLLWVDLNGSHHLVVFAALDWIKQGKPVSDPGAEYTLWLFPNDTLAIGGAPAKGVQHPPPALTRAIGRWAAEPLPGSSFVQNITHAILVDPDGTPHEVAPSALGVAPPPAPKPEEPTP
jgi:hypothetical protein